MKEIKCTNCGTGLDVCDEHYGSHRMAFNCPNCNALMKLDNKLNCWVSEGSGKFLPVRVLGAVPITSLAQRIHVWASNIVIGSWSLSFLYLLVALLSLSLAMIIDAIVCSVCLIFIAYFIRLLLDCLRAHLDNQDHIIRNTSKD